MDDPFDGIYSLTIEETAKRTGWSRSRLYRFLQMRKLDSYKMGKRRLIVVQSLKELLGELAASEPPADRPQGLIPRAWRDNSVVKELDH